MAREIERTQDRPSRTRFRGWKEHCPPKPGRVVIFDADARKRLGIEREPPTTNQPAQRRLSLPIPATFRGEPDRADLLGVGAQSRKAPILKFDETTVTLTDGTVEDRVDWKTSSAGYPTMSRVALYLRVSVCIATHTLPGTGPPSRGGEARVVCRERLFGESHRRCRIAAEMNTYVLRVDAHRPERPFDLDFRTKLLDPGGPWSPRSFVPSALSRNLKYLAVRFYFLREPMLDSSEDGSPSMARVSFFVRSYRWSHPSRVGASQSGCVSLCASFEKDAGRLEPEIQLADPVESPKRRPRGSPRLRGEGLARADVARRVGPAAETCRKADWLLKRARGAVDNSPSVQTVPVPPEEPKPLVTK